MYRLSIAHRFITLLALLACLPASANVVVNGTRFVYPAKQQEISVRVSNDGDQPSLVQAWIDRGDPATRPEQADAPFLLTPPIFRVDPGKGQSLRVAFIEEALPQDRETVFWFNMLDVPPLPETDDGNYMQFAIRTRLKLFYRPEKLAGSPERAIEQVTWRLVSTSSGAALRATNGSAFHVSLSDLAVQDRGRTYPSQGGMVAPHASHDFPLTDPATPRASAAVVLHWINDYGVPTRHEARLEP
ncbi:fimbrial biogenesis chaperone [Pseudomonas solani]|uniref:fimbrial biogenesis chaperone n=1 Tax=Pseudomonas solani TaxID=2731552 RepID=UPI003C2ADB76